jgi:hypothetical protein
MPGKYVGTIATCIAVFITGLWFYTQLLVWKSEGSDHMLTVGNVAITAVLWVMLLFALFRNLRDAHRAKGLREQLSTAENDRSVLQTQHSSEIDRLNSEWTAKLSQNSLSRFQELQAKYPLHEELKKRDETIKQLQAEVTAKLPLVTPVLYDLHDYPQRQARMLGILFSNDGGSVAYDVQVKPLKIGTWDTTLELIPRLEVNQKMPACVYMNQGHYGESSLVEHLYELQKTAGTIGSPIPFEVVYRDAQKSYVSVCEMSLDPMARPKGLRLKLLKRVAMASASEAL